MPLTVRQVLDYAALTKLQTGDISTTARRVVDLMEQSGDFPAPFSTSVRVTLEQLFVENITRGRIEGAFSIAAGAIPGLPVTLAVAPSLFAGTSRLSTYTGNAALVRNPALATQAIGFTSDRLNMDAVETFGGGANTDTRIATLYDQSGNGLDVTTAADGNRPFLKRSQAVSSAQPMTMGSSKQLVLPSGLSVDRANHAVFFVMRPVVSHMNDAYTTLGSNALSFGPISPDNNPNGGLQLRDITNSVVKLSQLVMRSDNCVVGYSSGPSGVRFYTDRKTELVSGALASGTLTGGVFSNLNGYQELYQIAVFNRDLTDTEMMNIGSALEAVAPPVLGQTTGMIFIGDSITAGQGSAPYTAGKGHFANEPRQFSALLTSPSTVAVFNFGQSSIPAGSYNARKALIFPQLLASRPEITKWVCRIHLGINDLRAHSTDTTVYTAVSQLAAYTKSLGIKTIVTTINKQGLDGTYGSSDETNRLSVNSQIRSNWASFADALVDYDAIPEASDPSNTTYFTADQLHQMPALYGLKAQLLLPTFNTLAA